MKATLICTGILALAASFGAAAQEASRNLTDPTANCIGGLASEPRLKLIADKVALGQGINAPGRALDRAATAEERAAVAAWLGMRKDCFDKGASYRRGLSTPQQIELTQDAFEYHQRLVARLQEGSITYTEFNRRRVRLAYIAAGQDI